MYTWLLVFFWKFSYFEHYLFTWKETRLSKINGNEKWSKISEGLLKTSIGTVKSGSIPTKYQDELSVASDKFDLGVAVTVTTTD